MKFLLLLIISISIVFSASAQDQPRELNKAERDFNQVSSDKTKCVWGNCENGVGKLLFTRSFNQRKTLKNPIYISVQGNFKNGRLEGFGQLLWSKNKLIFENKKGVPFDSVMAVSEVLNAAKSTETGGSYGFYKDGYLMQGRMILEDNHVYNGLFKFGQFIFGTVTSPDSSVTHKGFLCYNDVFPAFDNASIRTGLRLVIKKDSIELIPYHQGKKTSQFRPFAPSEYATTRTTVVDMPFDNGIYNGEVFAGKPEGFGEWIGNNHLYAKIGYFKNGLLHGLAALNYNGEQDEKRYPSFGYVLAEFKNGIAKKAATGYYSDFYIGEINKDYRPYGYGTMIHSGAILQYESGEFAYGKLWGYGTQNFSDGSSKTGNFVDGKLSSGTYIVTVNALRKGNVVKVNGKKFAVIDNPWFEHDMTMAGRGWVTLSDKSILKQGTPFEKLDESSSTFYKQCSQCGGTGNIKTFSNIKVLISNNVYTYEAVRGINNQRVEVTVSNPVYETKTIASGSYVCPGCGGEGWLLK